MAKTRSPEHDLQAAIVDLIRTTAPEILFSGTMGGVRLSMNQAKRAKAAGYLKGIPDLIFYEPRNGFHGLAIELKTKRGKISPIQRERIEDFRIRGWKAEVAFGYDETLAILRKYFDELAEI